MTAPKPGDRVRVVLEGEYQRSGETTAYLTRGDGGTWATFNDATVVSVEVLPPPEPEWQQRDVALSPLGITYERISGDRWIAPGSEQTIPHSRMPRPLTLIVRDGKPVQS